MRRAHPTSAVGKLALGLILAVLLAGGARAGEAFEMPRPGRVWSFPQDHGAHPEFKTEWWYYVGHVKAASGESFGYQLAFFRVGLRKLQKLRQPDPQARSAWSIHTVYFAHLALTDAARGTFFFREKAGRGALGLSGATTGTMKVWIDDWRAELQGEEFHLLAQDGGLGLDLVLKPLKPPALHGQEGYSRKSGTSGAASYYYSLPRLDTRGTIFVDGRRLPVTGESWMDHEFFTSAMAQNLSGWDWFSLQLEGGWEVMLYLLRHKDGSVDPASAGSLIDPAGGVRHLNLADFTVKPTGAWTSPLTRAKYPAGWEITIPGAGYRLRLTPTVPDQEIRSQAPARVTYWEGQVRIEGVKNGAPVAGIGYAELTGYDGG
ncbi:MAG: lipocalin-like domain-containing protein, partial [Deltaproteobacteria bacterium]|nr:lipocalin-like domain-containing protein [Deltaproteobacteria bacterium]